MSKEKVAPEPQNQPENNNLPAQAPTHTETLPAAAKGIEIVGLEDISQAVHAGKDLGKLEKLQVGTINLRMVYRSFEEKGETIRRVFVGFTLRQSVDPVSGEDKGLMPAVMMYDPASETIEVFMQSVIVGVIREVGYPKGAALQITYLGDAKSKSGTKYNNFDIRALVPAEK